MLQALLDTDILSELLRLRNVPVRNKALAYSREHGRFAFSAITRYEVVRGLRDLSATEQLARFETFCTRSLIFPLTDAIFDCAADLWVLAKRSGRPRNDADLIIAATAITHRRTLVTGNSTHFNWIPNLITEDWRAF